MNRYIQRSRSTRCHNVLPPLTANPVWVKTAGETFPVVLVEATYDSPRVSGKPVPLYLRLEYTSTECLKKGQAVS